MFRWLIFSFPYGPLITTHVGSEKQCFHIHESLLCQASDFFKAACNSNFKEADGVIDLPEQNLEVFKHFIYWLYTGKLRGFYYPPSTEPTIQDLKLAVSIELASQKKIKLEELDFGNSPGLALNLANYRDVPFHGVIAQYVLADVLQVHGLKDQVITLLIDIYGYTDLENRVGKTLLFWSVCPRAIAHKPAWLIGPSKGINTAWEMLPEGCHLRRLLLVLFCDNSIRFLTRIGEEPFNRTFEEEVFYVMTGRWYDERGTTRWRNGEICKYHDHDAECSLSEQNDFGDESPSDHDYLI